MVKINVQMKSCDWFGLFNEKTYMIVCSSTWIEMNFVVIKTLDRIKLCDFVLYNGYTIKPKYEHQIYDTPT